jgi:tetratricopeptide (TPR) repeat protein
MEFQHWLSSAKAGRNSWAELAILVLFLGSCTATTKVDRLPSPAAIHFNEEDRNSPLPSHADLRKLLVSGQFDVLDQQFSTLQARYESGLTSDEDLRAAFRVFYDTNPALASAYDHWVSAFPRSYVAHLVRGVYYTRIGENIPANQEPKLLPPSQIDRMEEAYRQGTADLNLSLSLNRRPILTYTYKLWITRAHHDVAESRRLLDLSLKIDSSNYIVRASYATAIETRWGGNQTMLTAFIEECGRAKLSERHMRLLESVVSDDQAWIHQFVDHDYRAAEAAYRRSGELGGDVNLHNLSDVLFHQHKYAEAIEPLTELLDQHPGDLDVLGNRGFAYIKSGKTREGISDWQTAAKGGSAYAQNELGRLYMLGVPGILTPDPKMGISLFRLAAAQGLSEGQLNLNRALQLYPQPLGHDN